VHRGQILLLVSAIWAASEIAVAIAKRARSGSARKDRGSLYLLWGTIGLSTYLGSVISSTVRSARIPFDTFWLGIALIIAGIIVRAIAIATLWRYFTVNVAIAHDHELIDRGMYRFIRHPSYTGSLISFLGLGLAFRNWISLALIAVATTAAFTYRVRVEEAALIEHFGDRYRDYMKRTRRFVPGVM